MASNSSSGDDDAEAGDGPPSPPASLLPHQSDATLLEAFRYVNSVPGKDVRGKLIESFQFWFRVEANEQLETIKDIVGDLHNASLLIDDIEDNSTLRRGNPVAHSIFGVPAVINTANYVVSVSSHLTLMKESAPITYHPITSHLSHPRTTVFFGT